ncbi:MAG TPA: zinc ribbon domain-containing protein [Nostocaceae cyanobacterium]|nr:zinc ribbon domain-containing protein [Nostocaceae cyanobacterium]
MNIVPPPFTSQNCSNCGHTVKNSLSEITHKCPKCGTVLNRDTNAAINILCKILCKAKSRGGHPQSNATGLETSTLVGENLPRQVSRVKVESPRL